MVCKCARFWLFIGDLIVLINTYYVRIAISVLDDKCWVSLFLFPTQKKNNY